MIPEPVDLVVCDASFISLTKVLETPLTFVKPGGRLLALIKPQFEAGHGEVGKCGVVRDPAIPQRVCAEVSDWLIQAQGWTIEGIVESPIKGPAANIKSLVSSKKTLQKE